MAAHTMISEYLTPKISAMIKAAAPMIGGRSWPPTEAAADTAPENSALNGKGSRRYNICNGTAIDGTQKTRSDNRNLGRTAFCMTSECKGYIVEEFTHS